MIFALRSQENICVISTKKMKVLKFEIFEYYLKGVAWRKTLTKQKIPFSLHKNELKVIKEKTHRPMNLFIYNAHAHTHAHRHLQRHTSTHTNTHRHTNINTHKQTYTPGLAH